MSRGLRAGKALSVAAGVAVVAACGPTSVHIKALPTRAFPSTWDAPAAVVAPPREVVREPEPAVEARTQVHAKGLKCAAMPLEAVGVPAGVAGLMDEILLSELQQAGFEAVGQNDINAMIGFERAKQAMGCDEGACIAEIGGALGVDFLIVGKAAVLQGTSIVTLKLLDVRQARVLARSNRMGAGGDKELPRLIVGAVSEVVRVSKL